MSLNYHNKLINEITNNQSLLEWHIEMYHTKIRTELKFNEGDIDILVTGIDVNTQNETQAIIEVKGHRGLVPHYLRHQLHKYKTQFPKAKQYVAYGNGKSIDFKTISIEQQ